MTPHDPDAAPSWANLDLALSAGLRHFGVDPHHIADLLEELARVIPSTLGMSIALQPRQTPVAFDVHLVTAELEPEHIASALTLTNRGLSPDADAAITFYASQPAAFTDLADTLVEACGVPPHDLDQDPPRPTGRIRPGIVGPENASAVQQALGILINRGHSLTEARAELYKRAQHADVDPPEAARLLRAAWHQEKPGSTPPGTATR